MRNALTIIAFLVCTMTAPAVEVPILHIMEDGHQWTVGAGAGYYTDCDDLTTVAPYIQTAVVKWEYCSISFGGTFVLDDLDKSRPHCSFEVESKTDIRMQFGPYVMLGPYRAWGFHGGVSFRF